MQEKDYLSVKDVAEMLETEAYVLRFYEKELNLDIKRNSKGHRVYTLEDVELFRKIQEMREQGLQLKAIETIVHDDSSEEAKETYEQLSGISLSPMTKVSNLTTSNLTPAKSHQVPEIDITDTEDEKVKQFSCLMKEMLKQALMECNEQSKEAMRETIKEEVNTAVEQQITTVVEEKVNKLQEEQDAKNEEYYRKLDETMREVQKMRKEMSEKEQETITKKEKTSFWSRLFKDKNESAQM